jgi:perosamine synthetase
MIPYGRQEIDEDDIQAVVDVLRSDWLTTGPKVAEFEAAIAGYVGAGHGVAVSSGTAALHAAMRAIGIGPGDEVIVPAITFAATANCVVYEGGTPIFADVDPETMLISAADAAERITPKTRAIIAVDYAGQPCDYAALRALADQHSLALVADGCHALGASSNDVPVGALADLTAFSFHPVKHITTGEGGMAVTDSLEWAERMRTFRNHGITTDHRQRAAAGQWRYEMVELGYNYRMSDLQCALGCSQLQKLDGWLERRRSIAEVYDKEFQRIPGLTPLRMRPGVAHAYHLYVIRVDAAEYGVERDALFEHCRTHGIGVQVHYAPVHLHPFYRKRFDTREGACPRAERAGQRLLSLPMHPGLTDAEVQSVLATLRHG